MVHTVTKRTSKRKVNAILKQATKRSRKKKGVDFSDLLGTAPIACRSREIPAQAPR